jgi:transcriptional regulator with XRE-family HTH domain
MSSETAKKSNFSDRLKDVRLSLRLTQDQMAERLDISGNYVYLLESGKNQPSEKLVVRLRQLEQEIEEASQENLKKAHVLHDVIETSGVETHHNITTKSELASACLGHFIAYLNAVGDTAWLLEKTLEKLRADFPTGGRTEPSRSTRYEQRRGATVKTDPRIQQAAADLLRKAAEQVEASTEEKQAP